jgi:chromosome segregation ATPase
MTWGWLLSLFLKLIGLLKGGRGTVVKFEARPQKSIDDDRKKIENLKAEVRRLEHEMAKLAPHITNAITACDGHRIIALNTERRRLRDQWNDARERLDDFERQVREGR